MMRAGPQARARRTSLAPWGVCCPVDKRLVVDAALLGRGANDKRAVMAAVKEEAFGKGMA